MKEIKKSSSIVIESKNFNEINVGTVLHQLFYYNLPNGISKVLAKDFDEDTESIEINIIIRKEN